MNFKKLILFSFLLLLISSCGVDVDSPKAIKGSIDLRKVDFERDGVQNLSGKWEFYWGQLLTPEDFKNKHLNPEYMYAPQGWGVGKEGTKEYPDFGYATYRLKVLLPENDTPYRLWINSIVSSSKIWINGQFLAEAGTVATNAAQSQMDKHSFEEYFYKDIYPSGGEMEILIQVSNFDISSRYSGLFTNIEIGTQEQIKTKDNQNIIPAFITIGILFVIALYYFVLFLYQRTEFSTLVFALISFIFIFRVLYESNLISRFIAPQSNIWVRLVYIDTYLYLALISIFFYLLFKAFFNKKVLKAILIFSAAEVILSIFAPLVIVTYLAPVALLIVPIIVYLTLIALKAMLKKEQGAIWAFLGILALVLATINDTLNASGLIHSIYITAYGMVIYVIFQAINIAERFSISFQENIFLNTKLDLQNKSLEKIVEVRTQEVRLQKEEILAQNEELQQQQEEVMAVNENLENKSSELQNKNMAVTDSIRYAQTIQQATLPPRRYRKQFFPDSFVLYRPKDIVSGDFFWIKGIENMKFIACVDCTGHGVPGAFMSMIGNNLLNEALDHKHYFEPSQILNYLNENIRIRLNQGENKNSDGMDLSICKFEQLENGNTKLTYAGAKGIIYAIKDKKLLNLKVDRCSIGGLRFNKEDFVFQDFEIELEKGSLVYLLSDGYIDQANNQRKRFGTARFKKLIEQTYQLPIDEQQLAFKVALDKHQEEAQQRDDITLLGIKT